MEQDTTARPVDVCAACWLARGRAEDIVAGRLNLKRPPVPCALCARPTMAGLQDAYTDVELDRAKLAQRAQALTDAAVAIALGAEAPLAPAALLAAYIRVCERLGVDPRQPLVAFLRGAGGDDYEPPPLEPPTPTVQSQRGGGAGGQIGPITGGDGGAVEPDRRCAHEHSNLGPRCCLLPGHDGPHRYKCCSPHCEGLIYPASERPHPCPEG